MQYNLGFRKRNSFLALKYQRKNDHPRIQLVDDVGIFQVWIAGVNIGKTIADLKLRRQYEDGEIKIKTNAGFHAIIDLGQFHQVLGTARRGIGGEVIFKLDAAKHIYAEIIDAV